MRIMVDTNTLLSSVLFPHGITAQAMEFILKYHTLILPTYVIQEAKVVMERKFPSFSFALQQFIDSLSFELAFSIEESRADVQAMPDPKDIPSYCPRFEKILIVSSPETKIFSPCQSPSQNSFHWATFFANIKESDLANTSKVF